MEVFEVIAKRHSYRGPYLDRNIPREDLRLIVQAGIQAPSGTNAQTTEFVIVDDAELVAQIAALHPTNTAMRQAKAYIACLIDLRPEAVYEGYSFQVEDCAAAAENMLLAITALGYATVWVDGWLRIKSNGKKIGEMLGIPQNKLVRIILPLGVPAEHWAQREKKQFEQRAWYNRYQTG
ncbi:MAG TPA: nitroreductase family protein [Oligoflexia bacterium]|nr:nitroreductase family protein [Oligoflexia bacterium]